MADEVKIMHEIGFDNSEIAAMASTNPAKLLGLSDRGILAVGMRADLVLVDANMDLASTYVAGVRPK